MMNEPGLRKTLPDLSSASGHTFDTARHPSVTNPIVSKRVCFYKSGDPQFSGLRIVINNRTFKTFDALLDSLSKKVPLPFGVRNITTPRGVHGINHLDELEDGKSYICSDTRKVKPINLALARKKLPPWYHARPISSRRQTVQQNRPFPGRRTHRQEPVLVRTPKKLVVFRNGDPSIRHTVVLHKKTAPSYESILDYISELMQFHVVKLHTPDGRRVDGLPGLILCSGTVVAVGREPFRPALYSEKKSSFSPRRKTNRTGVRRQRSLHRKKKSPPSSLRSRNFSMSSERYIVQQIHSKIAENSCHLSGDPVQSAELDSHRALESPAQRERDAVLVNEGEDQEGSLPNDDNIEKSFRVNQDGSMTVEMKVRLTIKEEETVHWTTTLMRSNVTDQPIENEAEMDLCTANADSLGLPSPPASIDTIDKWDNPKDGKDDDPPSPSNGAITNTSEEEVDMRIENGVASPPHRTVIQQHTSVESVTCITPDGLQEETASSYLHRQQMEDGRVTEHYCTMTESSTRPVPKPRRGGSVDVCNGAVSEFRSSEKTDILVTESSEEEVTESVLHIHEQQICQDNYLANVYDSRFPVSGVTFSSQAASEARQISKNEHGLHFVGPSRNSDSTWRPDSQVRASQSHLPPLKTHSVHSVQKTQPLKATNGKPQPKEAHKNAIASSKNPKTNKLVLTKGKKQKGKSAKLSGQRKKTKTFSSAGFLRQIYGNKMSSVKKVKRLQKRVNQSTEKGILRKTVSSSTPSTVRAVAQESNPLWRARGKANGRVSFETNEISASRYEAPQPRGRLQRQTSTHRERKSEKESNDVDASKQSLGFEPMGSVTRGYVENWLEKTHLSKSANVSEGSVKKKAHVEFAKPDKKEDSRLVAEKKVASELQPHQPSEHLQQSANTASVKQKIQSFENKSSFSHPNQGVLDNSSPKREERMEKTSNCDIIDPPPIPLEEMIPTYSLSVELPPPPPELLCAENVHSAASSPLYRLSSASSQMSDHLPPSVNQISPVYDEVHNPTSGHSNFPPPPLPADLSRTSSIKRAPLVSNLSLERKMSLRKASADKYASSNDASTETNSFQTSPIHRKEPIKVQEQTEPEPDLTCSPSICSSLSPPSSTSDERRSSDSISSSEMSVAPSFSDTKKTRTSKKEELSPKTPGKRVKQKSSPSPDRKSKNKKSAPVQSDSPKLAPTHGHPLNKTVLPSVGKEKQADVNSSPSAEKRHNKAKILQKPVVHSQSLDVMSPPVRHKSGKRLLTRNLSADNPADLKSRMDEKMPTTQKSEAPQSVSSKTETKNIKQSTEHEVLERKENTTVANMEQIQQSLNTARQPNMKPVLEKICYSIKSIRQLTQTKRPSCLEKSNSLPDFSSHVASTFGSSSKALLAFLSVMTSREALTSQSVNELNANGVSCVEALKMIDSLREIASIEDSHQLNKSLSTLQQSASKELLNSWKGFQALEDGGKSSRTSPVDQPGIEGNSIDDIMNHLNIPAKLKEELTFLSDSSKSESDNDKKEFVIDVRKRGEPPELNIARFFIGEPEIHRDEVLDRKPTIKTDTDVLKPKRENAEEHQKLDEKGYTDRNETPNFTTKAPAVQPNDTQASEKRQLHDTPQLDSQPSRNFEVQENSEWQLEHKDETQEVISICEEVVTNTNTNEESSTFETEEQNKSRSKTRGDHSSSKITLTHNATSSADKEQKVSSCSGSFSPKTISKQQPKELAASVKINQSSGEVDASDFHGNDKQTHSNSYVEVYVRERTTLPKLDNRSHASERQAHIRTGSMGLSLSTDESSETSDAEMASSEEEHLAVDFKKLHVIVEESGSDHEEVQEERQLGVVSKFGERAKRSRELEALIEEMEEDQISFDDDDVKTGEVKSQNTLSRSVDLFNESKDLYIIKDKGSLMTTENADKGLRFNEDNDSGKHHSSCEELEEEHLAAENPHFSSSAEDELSYFEKDCSSEEEQPKTDVCIEKRQETAPAVIVQENSPSPKVAREQRPFLEETVTQSVAERVILLEKQVAEAQKTKSTPSCATRRFPQRKTSFDSDNEDSPSLSPPLELALCTRSAPQSSLSFSYDSSVVTAEPEGSRVRSIREMFLARSTPDIPQRRIPSPKSFEPSEVRAETSGSGGYQSQTASDASSGEDDLARKSITKGFVKRTIERLYGKKKESAKEECDRPPSEPNPQKKEHSNRFSPLNATHSKALSEFSYFSSSKVLEALGEASRCITFNAQVVPVDSFPIDPDQWLSKGNTLMKKSVSDPIGINKTFTTTLQDEELQENAKEDATYSLPLSKPEVDDKTKPELTKCTYFSLPHASDSEICHEELSVVNKSSLAEDSVVEAKDTSEDTETWADRNGILPSVGLTDFKIKDNKVHPLIELPPEGEVVVAQPRKGYGVVNRTLQEPDALDLLYNFCGQHCPVL